MCAINDPLGKIHSSASSDHLLKVVVFCEILTAGNGRTDRRTRPRGSIEEHVKLGLASFTLSSYASGLLLHDVVRWEKLCRIS